MSGRYGFGTYDVEDHVALLTIDRQDVLNALHVEHHEELYEVWSEFQADDKQRVAILTGAGARAFSAGYDLKYAAEHPGGFFFQLNGRGGFGGLTSRTDIIKPVIAAVNGDAVGGGMDLVTACDLAIAVEGARFGMPEPRIGVPSGFGGLERLVREIPLKQAMEIILLAELISAERALELGVVNRVVPQGELMETAYEWARKIMLSAPLAVQANIAAARKASELPLDVAVRTVHPAVQRLWESEDFRRGEGPKAFAEKRAPRWSGS